MDFFDVTEKRRSVRKFTGDPIPKQDLEKIVNAARLAPNGSNKQLWTFIIITDRTTIERLSKAASWSEKAGAMIAVVVDPATKYWVEDGSAAIENILLAGTALGYGTCWLEGNIQPHEAEFKLLLNIPEHLNLLSLVPVGVPVEWPESKTKKSLEEVTRWETY